jgi:uncharacterized protein (DUF2267 family)
MGLAVLEALAAGAGRMDGTGAVLQVIERRLPGAAAARSAAA